MVVSEKEQGQCSLVKGQGKGTAVMDSGASHNFTPFVADFNGVMEPPEVRTVEVGDGKLLKVLGMGRVRVRGEAGLLTFTKVHPGARAAHQADLCAPPHRQGL